jgi:hypothetical protein
MSKQDIYGQHDAAFKRVEAHAVFREGAVVAKIAFKYPADGAGRLYAYVHWLGVPMVRGSATGYGYDKRTAACANAMKKLSARDAPEALGRFFLALQVDGGNTFVQALTKMGFETVQII